MIRKIIQIDESKCNGCGICAKACHEGAIGMVSGKAKLLRDDYCDGMGDCLPECPTGAISFVEREAAAYDEAAVKANMQAKALLETSKSSAAQASASAPKFAGCPGSAMKILTPKQSKEPQEAQESQLRNWPVQVKLAPVAAPYFDGADLLIAADCTAYSYGNFHQDFICGRVTLVACPKLDGVDYSEKLTAIFAGNDIRSITLTRMQVPCCGGLEMAVKKAIVASGKAIPLNVVTIGMDGKILK